MSQWGCRPTAQIPHRFLSSTRIPDLPQLLGLTYQIGGLLSDCLDLPTTDCSAVARVSMAWDLFAWRCVVHCVHVPQRQRTTQRGAPLRIIPFTCIAVCTFITCSPGHKSDEFSGTHLQVLRWLPQQEAMLEQLKVQQYSAYRHALLQNSSWLLLPPNSLLPVRLCYSKTRSEHPPDPDTRKAWQT